MESAASGLVAAYALVRELRGQVTEPLPAQTMLGALGRHVSTPVRDYQPMNISFGLIDGLDVRVRDKLKRYEAVSGRALSAIEAIKGGLPC